MVDHEPLPPQDRRHPAIPKALVITGELTESSSDALFFWPRCRGGATLGGARLAHHCTRPPLRDAEDTLKVHDGAPATTWA